MRRAVILLAGCIALAAPRLADAAEMAMPTSLVDTFIGTSGTPVGGPIDTFPGADLPFGMVQWSPDTPSQNAGGGYEYSDREITGFSLTHLSGPGCNVFGDFAVLPFAGAVPEEPSTLRQLFSHATEESAPGWYAVSVGNPAIRTELSVTARTGIARFLFPATQQAELLFNASSNQAGVTNAHISVDGPRELSGWASSGYFCGMPDHYTVYFAAQFDRPFTQHGTWSGAATSPGSVASTGPASGAWVGFDTTHDPQIIVRVGLSFVSVAGARENLAVEDRGWDIIGVRDHATDTWNGMLRRIIIRGGTVEQQRTFYSALYHTLLHPNLISDVSGSYAGFDGRIHHVRTGHREYANFSDWDIYRTEVPLLALIAPSETSDMMQSLVDAARQEGWLPRWALVNGPTSVMGGDSVDPVIAGAYAFGARDFDTRAALAAMIKGASTTAAPPTQGWYIERWELNDRYLQHGYVVNTHTTSVSPGPNGASETLEYALDDFSIARMAYALHDRRDYAQFMRRSSNWMTLFDTALDAIAPRDADGAFMQTRITENGQSGFQEGNSAQYTWMVPQDLRDLAAAMGGPAAASAKLDAFFSQLNAGQDKPFAWLGNEPSIGTPWVYLSLGEPWRAEDVVRRAMTTLYADTPQGIPGNDDLGTMSAWYVWCAIGLYPQNPAVAYLDVGTPLFPSVQLETPDGTTIDISSPQSNPAYIYVEGLHVNGRASEASWVALPQHGRLALDISAGAQPSSQWGVSANDEPPSFSSSRLVLPPATSAAIAAVPGNVQVSAGDGVPLRFALTNRDGSAVAVAWRAALPKGFALDRSSGRMSLAAAGTQSLTLQLATDPSLQSGYYNVRIDGTADNGAPLAHLIISVLVNRNGQRPAVAYAENAFGNNVTPVDLTTGATGPEIAVGEYPRDAVLSTDGTRLYVANLGGGSVSVVDTRALRTIATVKVGSSPNGIVLTPDGKTLWLANGDDGTIQSIDTVSLHASAPIAVGLDPRALAFSPSGDTLYVSDNRFNRIARFDLRSRTLQTPLAVGERPNGLAVTPDGRRLYVVESAENDVRAIDLATGAAIARIRVGVDPIKIVIARNGRIAYVTNYGNSTVTPIDLTSNSASSPIDVGGAPYGITMASDGRTAVVVSHRDNACRILDLMTGRAGPPVPLGIGPYTVAVP